VKIDEVKKEAALTLAEISRVSETFASPVPELLGDVPSERISLSPQDFPVPELILFGLRKLCDLKSWGPFEKLRWGISAQFRKVQFSVTLQQFGLHLYIPVGTSADMQKEIVRYLQKIAKLAENCLRDQAKLQIEAGNVTIENQYHRFDGAYQFFRDRAKLAYESPPAEPVPFSWGKDGKQTGWSQQPWKYQIEGGYLAAAMLDAYFSRLEHLLVLVLSFTDFEPSSNGLVEFVGKKWGEKFQAIFDVRSDPDAARTFQQLQEMKEMVRNPMSHGGFRKKGTSFLFHLEDVGALPGLLTKEPRSFELWITPVPQRTYEELCKQLDAVDAFFERSKIAAGVRYAKSGLNVVFSADYRAAYHEASESLEDLEEFIRHQGNLTDRHRNMDY